MKNTLYVIAGLLLVIWFIIILSFETSVFIHLLFVAAIVIILIRIIFGKQLTGKRHNGKVN